MEQGEVGNNITEVQILSGHLPKASKILIRREIGKVEASTHVSGFGVYRDLSERQTISYPVLRWKLRNRAFVHRAYFVRYKKVRRDYG
jgi:hypothetical protein